MRPTHFAKRLSREVLFAWEQSQAVRGPEEDPHTTTACGAPAVKEGMRGGPAAKQKQMPPSYAVRRALRKRRHASWSRLQVTAGHPSYQTERVAERVVLLYEAEMVALVGNRTAEVLTTKEAMLAPAGTVTVEGTLATEVLLLESATCAPPAGAGPLRVTVPVEDCAPPITLLGFSDREATVGGGGVTVREADRVTPL
jgi:hypothetical protein